MAGLLALLVYSTAGVVTVATVRGHSVLGWDQDGATGLGPLARGPVGSVPTGGVPTGSPVNMAPAGVAATHALGKANVETPTATSDPSLLLGWLEGGSLRDGATHPVSAGAGLAAGGSLVRLRHHHHCCPGTHWHSHLLCTHLSCWTHADTHTCVAA